MTLQEIYERYKSTGGHGDKGTTHSYIPIYEKLLMPYRDCLSVYEIGVAKGLSLKMWRDYFSRAHIYGVDFDPPPIQDPRITIFKGDGTTLLPELEFDVIIDDGSHKPGDQAKSVDLLWPSLRDGGLYVIEDLKKSFRDFEYHHGGKCEDDGIAWKIK